MIKEKFLELVSDQRSFKERFRVALLVSVACVFTFVVFGILDLVISNGAVLPFMFKQIAGPVLIMGLICFAVLILILTLCKGKLFDIAVSLAVGLLLAGYIQGNFLNLDLGQLTGDAIEWNRYTGHAVKNLIIWAVITLLPLIIYYFNKNVWKKAVIIVPILLFGMQFAALASSILTTDVLSEKEQNKYLSTEGYYEVSSQDNIIVFLLDRLDGKYIDEVFQDDADFFEPLDGFTYFPNHTSLYCRTYPSVPYMLTGEISYYETPAEEFFEKAWGESTFLPDLRSHNYTTKLYIAEGFTHTNAEQLEGLADNIAEGQTRLQTMPILKRLAFFSAYRYAPHSLKASFWLSSDEFNQFVVVDQDPAKHVADDPAFYQNLVGQKLSTQEDKNNFSFYHFTGSHTPLSMNENAEKVPEEQTSILQQTKGCFKIIYEYISQMKELGIYDNATIIITGDHGKSEDFHLLDMYKTTGLFVKPSGSSEEPFQQLESPVSHANFRATIMKEAGIETDAYGKSVFEVPENADVIRRFLYRVNPIENRPGILEEFEIIGDARDFSNWRKITEHEILYPHA